ncbi:sodium-dependent phosphate transport protein 2B-like [Oncorhynchus keta]|uniref:sodium-dependent phosphate transport protein 2B-like n=1 Tax=Oncorhynchus keta TaxID=8018 RepID=UPI00227B8C40|nr:sodium-dependent phosphate transport protein 2B-like [Oncorhynchus keta]
MRSAYCLLPCLILLALSLLVLCSLSHPHRQAAQLHAREGAVVIRYWCDQHREGVPSVARGQHRHDDHGYTGSHGSTWRHTGQRSADRSDSLRVQRVWYHLVVSNPFTRIPIRLAKALGDITAEYRWFAGVYIISCFFLLPLFVFGLSMAGWKVLVGVGVPIVALLIIIIIVNVLQARLPSCLPAVLHSWDFLPLWAHSLEPWDRVVAVVAAKCCCCCKCCQTGPEEEEEEEKGRRRRRAFPGDVRQPCHDERC